MKYIPLALLAIFAVTYLSYLWDVKYLYGGKKCVRVAVLIAKVKEGIKQDLVSFVKLAWVKGMFRNS
jgi:hypothetical protein